MKKFTLVIIAIMLILIFGFYTINSFKAAGTGNAGQDDNLTKVTLKVDIPCPGHASLIQGYLIKAGVSEVKFKAPNLFDVYYDQSRISKDQIMSVSIFQEYPAKIIN